MTSRERKPSGARNDATMPLTPPGRRQGPGQDPLLGRVLDERFRLRLVLGEGGMGKVYLAEDTKLNGRRVALKLMGPGMTMDQEFRARFEREAVLQANLPHPQIIQILDMGECPEGAYIVMEYSDGRSLAHLLRELGPLPLERALAITEQILEVLDFAHGQNVVHRDLKPANILMEERPGREVVRLLDFGIAKLLSHDGSEALAQTLTRQGYAYGTLGYMAPEQARGETEHVDHRADIYATGIILHEMLTGEVPAPPESRTHPVRYAMWVAENRIKPLSESHPQLQIAEQMDQVLQKALRREPENRYQSALAFRNAIREFRQNAEARTSARQGTVLRTEREPVAPARRGGSTALLAWFAAAILAAAAGLSFWMYLQERDGGFAARERLGDLRAALASMGLPDEEIGPGLAALKKRVAELEKAAGDADPRNLEQLKGQLEKARQALAEAEGAREGLTQAKQTAESERDAARKTLEEAQAAVEAERQEQARKLATAQEAATGLRGQIQQLEGDLSNQKKEVERLEQANAELKAQGTGGRDSTAELTSLRQNVQALEQEKQGLERRLQEEEKAAAEAQRRVEAINAEASRVRQDLGEKEAAVTQLQQQVKTLEEEKAQLEQAGAGRQGAAADPRELAEAKAEKERLDKALRDAYSRINDLQGDVARLEGDKRELQAEIRGLRTRPGDPGRVPGGRVPGGREPGRRTVPRAAVSLTIKNRCSQMIELREVQAILQGGGKQSVPLPADPEVTSGQQRVLQLPAGTVRVKVTWDNYNWAKRRFERRPVDNEWAVNAADPTIEIENRGPE